MDQLFRFSIIIFSSRDKKYSIFVNDEEKYIVDEKLTVEDEEMVMIKLLDNFFDDNVIEQNRGEKCLQKKMKFVK